MADLVRSRFDWTVSLVCPDEFFHRTNRGRGWSLEHPIKRFPIRAILGRIRVVIESYADGATVVATVLPDDGGCAQLPQPGVVVTAHGDEISRVGAEGAVPDPALVVVEDSVAGQRTALGDEFGEGSESRRRHGWRHQAARGVRSGVWSGNRAEPA